jgi:hypothetical protein
MKIFSQYCLDNSDTLGMSGVRRDELGKYSPGRPKCRWEDKVKYNSQKQFMMVWTRLSNIQKRWFLKHLLLVYWLSTVCIVPYALPLSV